MESVIAVACEVPHHSAAAEDRLALRLQIMDAEIAEKMAQVSLLQKESDVLRSSALDLLGPEIIEELEADAVWHSPSSADFATKYLQNKVAVYRKMASLAVRIHKLQPSIEALLQQRSELSEMQTMNHLLPGEIVRLLQREVRDLKQALAESEERSMRAVTEMRAKNAAAVASAVDIAVRAAVAEALEVSRRENAAALAKAIEGLLQANVQSAVQETVQAAVQSAVQDTVQAAVQAAVQDTVQAAVQSAVQDTVQAAVQAAVQSALEASRRQSEAAVAEAVAAERNKFNGLLVVGDRVRRGPNWEYDDQDGDPPTAGTVCDKDDDDEDGTDGWYAVQWDCGYKDSYRFQPDENIFDVQRISE